MSGFTPPWLSDSGYGETQHRVGEGNPGPAFNPTYPNLELLNSVIQYHHKLCFDIWLKRITLEGKLSGGVVSWKTYH
jgi:hypothetical protein